MPTQAMLDLEELLGMTPTQTKKKASEPLTEKSALRLAKKLVTMLPASMNKRFSDYHLDTSAAQIMSKCQALLNIMSSGQQVKHQQRCRVAFDRIIDVKNSVVMMESHMRTIKTEVGKKPVGADVKSLYCELASIAKRWPRSMIEWGSPKLVVNLGRIVLEGFDFGEMTVTLDLGYFVKKLQGVAKFEDADLRDLFVVTPLSPIYGQENHEATAEDSEVEPEYTQHYHPHVSEKHTVCHGPATAASCLRALDELRVMDALELTVAAINSYNDQNPYVEIEAWCGKRPEQKCNCCSNLTRPHRANCNHVCCESCEWECNDCNKTGCSNCISSCRGCEQKFCNLHIAQCSSCQEEVCKNCLVQCKGCKEYMCSDCTTSCANGCARVTCRNCASSCATCDQMVCNRCSTNHCSGCDTWNCNECSSSCTHDGCNDYPCRDCMSSCENCGDSFCGAHLNMCVECKEYFCDGCLEDYPGDPEERICKSCLFLMESDEDEEDEESPLTTTPDEESDNNVQAEQETQTQEGELEHAEPDGSTQPVEPEGLGRGGSTADAGDGDEPGASSVTDWVAAAARDAVITARSDAATAVNDLATYSYGPADSADSVDVAGDEAAVSGETTSEEAAVDTVSDGLPEASVPVPQSTS